MAFRSRLSDKEHDSLWNDDITFLDTGQGATTTIGETGRYTSSFGVTRDLVSEYLMADSSDDVSVYGTPLQSPVKQFPRRVNVEQGTQGVPNSTQGQQREAASFIGNIVHGQEVSIGSQSSSCNSLSSSGRLQCLLPNCQATAKDVNGLIVHLNNHLNLNPHLIYDDKLYNWLNDNNRWFCSACGKIYARSKPHGKQKKDSTQSGQKN